MKKSIFLFIIVGLLTFACSKEIVAISLGDIQNKTDGISYDFGQYRLNKLYKPLVKYFIDQFMESL